ncbi:MAG: AgmX/PglI C-terminal domain-containing protein [Myxococcales bacterium]|nr:AgmX/PglI C-terminal domain-containing protein [Myxococcales bacterium]
MRSLSLCLVAASLAAACSRTGTGAGVRTDITARMQSAQAPIQQCYADALQRNRKLRGMMVVMFRAAADSGQFGDLTVARDEPGDPTLRQCVLGEVGKLKLQTPQRTSIEVSYPINFQPTK